MLRKRVEKVYPFELESKFMELYGVSIVDYRVKRFFKEICNDGILKEVKIIDKPKYRFTFPLYVLCALLISLGMVFRWFCIGDGYYNTQSWVVRTMYKWKTTCRFNFG